MHATCSTLRIAPTLLELLLPNLVNGAAELGMNQQLIANAPLVKSNASVQTVGSLLLMWGITEEI